MSLASERKALRELLPQYSLMSIPHLAAFLGCGVDVARQMVEDGVLPSVRVGARRHVDPVDAAVYVLAEREGLSSAEYWTTHGEAVAEHVRRFAGRIRRMVA